MENVIYGALKHVDSVSEGGFGTRLDWRVRRFIKGTVTVTVPVTKFDILEEVPTRTQSSDDAHFIWLCQN